MEERTIISLDYAMKYLLRDKADFGILSGLLSELLEKKVTVDAILESESNKVDPDEKTNRLDLKARIDDGEVAVFDTVPPRDRLLRQGAVRRKQSRGRAGVGGRTLQHKEGLLHKHRVLRPRRSARIPVFGQI